MVRARSPEHGRLVEAIWPSAGERQAAMTSPFLVRQEAKPCSALY